MTLEGIQKSHSKTQRKIEMAARDRHLESKGRWEGAKSLAETIQDIEDRVCKLESNINGINELLDDKYDAN